MAENQIRNLKKLAEARGLEGTGIPAGFDQNIGTSVRFAPGEQLPAGMSQLEAEILGRKTPAKMTATRGASVGDISNHADVLRERFRRAQVEAGKLMDKVSKSKKSGEKLDINNEAFAKPFNDLIDHVRTVASNAGKDDGGDPTVLADVASALVSLDPQTRSMVLRRAGNPEVFEPLRDGELPPTPEGGIGDEMKRVQVAAQVDKDEKAIKRQNSVVSLPAIKRPSSHLARPDSIKTKGKDKGGINPSSEQYKSYLQRDHSPLNVGENSADTTKREALWTLAGDQLRERRGIQNKMLLREGMDADQIEKLPPKDRAAKFPPDEMTDAILPPAVGKMVDSERTLKTGTDPNYWRPGDRKKTIPGQSGVTVDEVVAGRNRGTFDKLLEMMYSQTMPKPATDPATGEAIINRKFSAVEQPSMAEPHDTTIDLDRYFPWWRGRYGELDDKSELAYPARMPTAEFVTGMIEGMLGAKDPEFFDRMLPLIQRSIDAAPDVPDSKYRPEGGKGRTAHQYSQIVFLPSDQFETAMKSGVGSADYPYAIYGDREVPRDPVTAPERHPFAKAQAEAASSGGVEDFRRLMGNESAAPDAAAPEESSGGVEEFRRLMQDRPALGDQSSIYRVRPASPLSALLA